MRYQQWEEQQRQLKIDTVRQRETERLLKLGFHPDCIPKEWEDIQETKILLCPQDLNAILSKHQRVKNSSDLGKPRYVSPPEFELVGLKVFYPQKIWWLPTEEEITRLTNILTLYREGIMPDVSWFPNPANSFDVTSRYLFKVENEDFYTAYVT